MWGVTGTPCLYPGGVHAEHDQARVPPVQHIVDARLLRLQVGEGVPRRGVPQFHDVLVRADHLPRRPACNLTQSFSSMPQFRHQASATHWGLHLQAELYHELQVLLVQSHACRMRCPMIRPDVHGSSTAIILRRECRACKAVDGVELDVPDGCPIHVVLDNAGPRGAQVEQGHQAVGGAHRALQPAVVKAQRRQPLPGLECQGKCCFRNFLSLGVSTAIPAQSLEK